MEKSITDLVFHLRARINALEAVEKEQLEKRDACRRMTPNWDVNNKLAEEFKARAAECNHLLSVIVRDYNVSEQIDVSTCNEPNKFIEVAQPAPFLPLRNS